MGRPLPLRHGTNSPPGRTRRRYKYRRRHTPHFYLVLAGLLGATSVCVLDVAAFLTRRMDLSNAAFIAVAITSVIVFAAYFYGILMITSGHIPPRRVLVIHGMVGTVAPLFYTLNISAAFSNVGVHPVNGLTLAVGIAGLVMLLGQVMLGRAVVKPDPLRLIRPEHISPER